MLPHLLLALDNDKESGVVKKKTCLALDVFCEHLGSEIVPYIDPLMRKLAALLKSSKDPLIQASVISAIKSTAVAAKEAYRPYYADTIKIMAHLMSQTSDELLVLRCRVCAMHCVLFVFPFFFFFYPKMGDDESVSRVFRLNTKKLCSRSDAFNIFCPRALSPSPPSPLSFLSVVWERCYS